MEDRIGQRLLRMFGLQLAGEKPDKPERAETLAQPSERAPRTAEDTVARFEANPFFGEEAWTPKELPEPHRAPDEPDASRLAEHVVPTPAREEVTERAPAHVDEAEPQEKQDVEESHEPDHRDEQERDDEDRPGGAWVMEEGAQEEADPSKGLRQQEALGEESRCHGALEDGTRCLRKPIDGKAYCLEHAAGSAADASEAVDAAAGEEVTEQRVEAHRPEPEPEPLINFGSRIVL